jgi:hypothetical protein
LRSKQRALRLGCSSGILDWFDETKLDRLAVVFVKVDGKTSIPETWQNVN